MKKDKNRLESEFINALASYIEMQGQRSTVLSLIEAIRNDMNFTENKIFCLDANESHSLALFIWRMLLLWLSALGDTEDFDGVNIKDRDKSLYFLNLLI